MSAKRGGKRRRNAGAGIVGGSTDDGKGTTLVRNLRRLCGERDRQVSVRTLEDPIEHVIPGDGISQVAVPPGKTREERYANFTEALRAFVTASPGTGAVAEIRCPADEEEARRLGLAVVKKDES